MKMRRLNNEGIRRMVAFLDSLTTDEPQPYPQRILTDPQTSEALPIAIEVEATSFPRRYDAAEYIHSRLSYGGLAEPERDPGLWTWLSLLWFDQLCPSGRKPGEQARWIPQVDNARRYYRHLLLGPYMIYVAHADDPRRAMCVLSQPLYSPGDIVEQIGSRPQLVTSKAVTGAATRMYCLPDGGLRRGAGGKGKGSPRRLGTVVMQFDRTFDLHTIEPERFIQMLPREFDRWKS